MPFKLRKAKNQKSCVCVCRWWCGFDARGNSGVGPLSAELECCPLHEWFSEKREGIWTPISTTQSFPKGLPILTLFLKGWSWDFKLKQCNRKLDRFFVNSLSTILFGWKWKCCDIRVATNESCGEVPVGIIKGTLYLEKHKHERRVLGTLRWGTYSLWHTGRRVKRGVATGCLHLNSSWAGTWVIGDHSSGQLCLGNMHPAKSL